MRVILRVKAKQEVLALNHTLNEMYQHVLLEIVGPPTILMEDPQWMEAYQKGEFTVALQLTPSGTVDLRVIPDQENQLSPEELEKRTREREDYELEEARKARELVAKQKKEEADKNPVKPVESKASAITGEGIPLSEAGNNVPDSNPKSEAVLTGTDTTKASDKKDEKTTLTGAQVTPKEAPNASNKADVTNESPKYNAPRGEGDK